MSKKISRDNVFFAFHPDLEPVLYVNQGEEVLLETHDCFEGQLKSDRDLIDQLDWDHINPATGPVYIEGAKPGDTLRIDLLEVKTANHSIMVTLPGEGALGESISEMETTFLTVEDDTVTFKNKIKVPKNIMIGVIGVAPEEEKIPNGTPGAHGGNMDCSLINEGASIYFTVGVEGALFGAGDLHSAMGDGEIVICGAEAPGEVRFTAKIVDSLKGLPTPFIRNSDVVATVFSAPTIDEAADGAIQAMSSFLTNFVKIPLNDAGMLMSLAGNLKICQIVDPEKTVRFEFPISILDQYDYSLD
jgi:amidase